MQDLITVPMVDVISEITGRAVVMKDTSYVFFDTKEVVDDATISEATLLKVKKEDDARVSSINVYTQSFIYSKYPQPKQSSANLGIYDEAYKNEMVAYIKRIVDLSNEAIDNSISFEDFKDMINEL